VTEHRDRVLITGVGRGLGRALFEAFLLDGWRVFGTVRTAAGGEELAAKIDQRLQAQATILPLELSDHAACARIDGAISEPLDVIINSAATFGGDAFIADNFSSDAFMRAFAVNSVAPLVLAKALKERLLQGQRRLIIMMSTGNASLAGNTGGQMLAYRASKTALNQIVRSLAAEWGPQGLTAVALNPGWVRTEMGGANAPLAPSVAANNIVSFTRAAVARLNGAFVNTDGSQLPW
jgi:NAD(P)-dependent dehydrogenase (short-subunit alcohol dehydrogenase family)